MRYILTLIAFCFLGSFGFAQIKFKKTYGASGYDEGRCVKQTYDGGYIIAGSSSSFGAGLTDMFLMKVDSDGIPQWQRTFGGSSVDKGYSLDITSDSGFVICGYTNSMGAGGYDVYLVRTDKDGNFLWQKTFGGTDWDFGSSVVQTSDGGYLIGGGTYSMGAGDEDYYVIKTNSAGDLQWQKYYGFGNKDYASEVIETSDGYFLVIGNITGSNNIDAYLLKLNASGDTLWSRAYGDTAEDYGMSVKETLTNEYLIAGYSNDSLGGTYDEKTIKIDTSGTIVWIQILGGNSNEMVNHLVTCFDGKFAHCGKYDGSGNYDMRLERINSGGGYEWSPTFGGLGYDEAFHLEQTADSGYIIVGMTQSFVSFRDRIFLVKVDSAGDQDPNVVNVLISVDEIAGSGSHQCMSYTNETGATLFHFPQSFHGGVLKIYDIEGRCLQILKMASHSEISSTLSLQPGIYFYNLNNKNANICSGKFIVIQPH